MMLKYFREPHFELQPKAQILEESMHIISLQTMIVLSSFPISIMIVTFQHIFN
jgi:hypothetical protein